MEERWTPNVLVLGPGGGKGFLELGALFELTKSGFLSKIDTYVGVSVGSIISLLLVVGYTVEEIITLSVEIKLFHGIADLAWRDIKDNIGLLSNESIKTKLSSAVTKKLGYIPSLKSIYMITGIRFTAISYNVTDEVVAVLSESLYPDMSCVDAVMLSMNIPFIFYQLVLGEKVYIDGALGNPYPVDLVDNGTNKVLGLYIEENMNPDKGSSYYLHKVLHVSMTELRKRIISGTSANCKHIKLTTDIMDTVGLSLTNRQKAILIASGMESAAAFLETL